ncbi:MAG: DUF58 domain-containing protein [Opitutaceae bacterium]
MPNLNDELKGWHDWTNPDFFQNTRGQEQRIIPLFLRQLLPVQFQKTKLTLIGWMLIIVAMGIGSAAYNTASNILFMTLSLLLSSLVLSGILSLVNFRKLKWDLCAPHHLQVGEVGVAEIDVSNEKSIFPTMSICFSVGSSAVDTEERLYLQHALSPGANAQLEWTFVPKQRGVCSVYLSGVTSIFPFGFLEKVMGHEVKESVLVWPEPIDFTFMPTSGGQRFLSGRSKRTAGLGSDLLNLRPYIPGDSPRLIHWKATARTKKLTVRQLAQEGESGYHLVVDTDRNTWDAVNFETLCSLLCSLANDLFHDGRLDSIRVDGQSPMVIQNMRDLHDFFDVLALLERKQVSVTERAYIPKNSVTFRPCGERSVAIYVDEKKAGQADG